MFIFKKKFLFIYVYESKFQDLIFFIKKKRWNKKKCVPMLVLILPGWNLRGQS